MNTKKIAQLIEKAKQRYSQKTQYYNSYLNRTYPPNFRSNITQSNSSDNSQGTAQDGSSSDNQPLINVVGQPQNPGSPINIIAKNYINPDSFEDGSEEKEEKVKKSHELAKIPDKLIEKINN